MIIDPRTIKPANTNPFGLRDPRDGALTGGIKDPRDINATNQITNQQPKSLREGLGIQYGGWLEMEERGMMTPVLEKMKNAGFGAPTKYGLPAAFAYDLEKEEKAPAWFKQSMNVSEKRVLPEREVQDLWEGMKQSIQEEPEKGARPLGSMANATANTTVAFIGEDEDIIHQFGAIGKMAEVAKWLFLELPSRASASIMLSTREKYLPEMMGGESRQTITPETTIERFLWGKEDIKTIGRLQEDAKEWLESFGIGSSASQTIALIGVPVALGMDLLPFGNVSKTALARSLKGATKVRHAKSILTKSGVPANIADVYAPRFAKLKDIGEINKGIKSMEGVINAAKQMPKPVVSGAKDVAKPGIPGRLGLKSVGLAPELSPFIKKREATLLRDKMKALSRGAREGSIATRDDIIKAGNELDDILKRSGVPKDERYKFITEFKEVKGVDDLIKKLPKITARVDRIVNRNEIKRLTSSIVKEIETAIPKKKNGILVGKFGEEASLQIDFLRGKKTITGETVTIKQKTGEGLHLTGDRAKAQELKNLKISEYIQPENGVLKEVPPSVLRDNSLLDMVGIQEMNANELENVLSNIRSIKETGMTKEALLAFNKETELQRLVSQAVREFTSYTKRTKVAGVEGVEINPISKLMHIADNALYQTEYLVRKATYSKTDEIATWVSDKLIDARNSHGRTEAVWRNIKVSQFKKIFGEKRLGRTHSELSKEKTIFKGKDAFGEPIELKLNQFEAGYWYGLLKDPTNHRIFTENMGWTKPMFKSFYKSLDPKMIEYVDWIVSDYMKVIREPVAKRYAEKFGTALANNPNYLPRSYSGVDLMDETINLFKSDAFPTHPTALPSGIKERIGSRMGFRKESIELIVRRHSNQMNQFIHFDEVVSDFKKVFNNPEVSRAIKSTRGGKELHETLLLKIDDIARGSTASSLSSTGVDWLISNFTRSSLMFNFLPFLKQLTSYPAFLMGKEGLETKDLISGTLVFLRNPVAWTKKFSETDFIFNRLTNGFDRETALAFKNGNKAYTIEEVELTLESFLKNSIVTPTRGGDVIPILPGLTAKYTQTFNHLKRTTDLPREEIHKRALRAAEKLVSQTQQSSWIENVGRIQSANWVGKAVSMFGTSPIQYQRETINAARMGIRGQISAKRAITTIVTSYIILPQLFQFVCNGFTWNEERQKRALILGPINYYPAVGSLAGLFYDAFTNGETWQNIESSISPLFGTLNNAREASVALGKLLLDDDLSEEKRMKEWEEFARNLYITAANIYGKAPSTLPRTIDGILDLTSGETDDLRRIIYSEWSLDDGEDEPSIPGLRLPKIDSGVGKIDSGFKKISR